MTFSRRPTAHLFEKFYTENVHQISLTLLKVDVRGSSLDMHYFDLDLGTQTRSRYGSDLLAC